MTEERIPLELPLQGRLLVQIGAVYISEVTCDFADVFKGVFR